MSSDRVDDVDTDRVARRALPLFNGRSVSNVSARGQKKEERRAQADRLKGCDTLISELGDRDVVSESEIADGDELRARRRSC